MKGGKTAGLMFFAFDLLFLGDQDLRTLPLMERKKRLQSLLAENKDQKMIQLAEHTAVPGVEVWLGERRIKALQQSAAA